MLVGYLVSYWCFIFAVCYGQNYFFNNIKIHQDPTTTSVVIEEKPADNSTNGRNSSASSGQKQEELHDEGAEKVLSELFANNVENVLLNSSTNDSVHGKDGESNSDVEDQSPNRQPNNGKIYNENGDLLFSTLNKSLKGILKVRELTESEKKRLANVLESMAGKKLPSVEEPRTNSENSSNETGTFNDLYNPLNDTTDDNFETLYPNPDEVMDQLSEELKKLIKYHKSPFWEKMKYRLKFPAFYHTHGTISLPYDGIVEPFEAWFAGKYKMSRIDYYYGTIIVRMRTILVVVLVLSVISVIASISVIVGRIIYKQRKTNCQTSSSHSTGHRKPADALPLNFTKEEHEKRFGIPHFYHSDGVIHLPYDDIHEPFEVWYAGDYNMSRIDYYYGMDKTFQRGDLLDYGVMVKVIPVHWGKNKNLDKNSISCWYRPGFRWAPQRGQSVIPNDLAKFKFAGEEIRSGMPTLKYMRKTTTFNKTNTYTLYITKDKPHRPLRYVMHGRDTLLHSSYDHYVIDYLTFHPWKFDFEVMKIPKGNYCEKELNKHRSKLHFNPMAEFMHENFDDVDVEESYEHYKTRHGKDYPDEREHEQRKNIFRHNMRYIRSHNRAGLNYTLESNELADVTDEDFEAYKGLLIDPSGGDEALKKQEIPQVRFSVPKKPLPENLDWREYGAVTPAKAQGHCGSCWTFSAMGPIEGAFAIQTGKLVDFSEQQLLDCSWGFGNNGCRGGYSWRALVWARKFGVTSSKSYGRYLSQEGYCHCVKKNCSTVHFSRMMTTPKKDEDALMRGLAWYGPASIAVNVNRKSFKFYSSGVLDDPKCAPHTNHGVVIVGYGEENGKKFWLIKNSWGKFWGDEGFIKISRKNNQCGILTNEPIFIKFNTTSSLHGKSFPFLRMEKISFIDMERKMNVSALKLSPFDYKRSEIDFWTPPEFIRNKKTKTYK